MKEGFYVVVNLRHLLYHLAFFDEIVSGEKGVSGGHIIMGVKDDGTPIGVNQNMIKDMKKNFVNQLNNPMKMSPTLYLSIEEFEKDSVESRSRGFFSWE